MLIVVLELSYRCGMASFTVEEVDLHTPSLDEICGVLNSSLNGVAFHEFKAEVVDTNTNKGLLDDSHFKLAANGICGSCRIVDVGGVPNLIPIAHPEKVYDLNKVAQLCDLPGGFIIGAGAGPYHHVGTNSEMIINMKTQSETQKEVNHNHICKIDPENQNSWKLEKIESSDFCMLGNFFLSNGDQGEIIHISAKKRLSSNNVIALIREALKKTYDNKPIGLGGVFIVSEGKVKTHVMPEFSSLPLNSNDDVNYWLKFFEMSRSFSSFGILMSEDPNLDLRIDHFHGYNLNLGEGGHFHHDTTPDDVEYHMFLNIAEKIYRIDRPSTTHIIGRD